jgi:hypothetical protein
VDSKISLAMIHGGSASGGSTMLTGMTEDDWATVLQVFRALRRLAIFRMVAQLHPVAAWICDRDDSALSIAAMPALRVVSSFRPW